MADLVTRLLLDDKQFNDNIKRSRKQAQSFDKGIAKLKGGMMALAGTLGVAMGASEAFNTAVRSSQATSDAFDKTLAQAKGGVDFFFQSIATGDFSNFLTGLDDAIRRGGQLALALDVLGDRIAGWDDTSSEITMKIAANRADIQDETTTTEERERLLEKQAELINELEETAAIVNKDQEEAILRTVESIANIDNVTMEEVTGYLQKTSLGINRELDEYIKEVDRLKRISKETIDTSTIVGDSMVTSSRSTQAAEDAKEELRVLREKNALLDREYQINNLVMDLQRQGIVADRNQIRQRNVMIAGMKRQLSRDMRRDFSGAGSGGDGGDDIIPGSLKDIAAQIKDANDALLNATTEEVRRTWAATIKELEARKLQIEIEYKFTTPGRVDPVGTGVSTSAIIDVSGVPIVAPVEEDTMSSFETYMSILADAQRQNEQFTMSAYAMGDALYAMAGATEGSASAWLSWGANILGSIGTAIPAIMALTTVQAASATTAAADAGAKAASSVAGIPVVGPILAVGAVASIIAALMSIPKFEHGGIVGGASYSGDNILARVNSGEMILNSSQQGNLFRMINNSSSYAPGSRETIGKIRQKEIVFMVEQEMRRRSRI